jgi:tetratricopeptide (TPR) repeat protein
VTSDPSLSQALEAFKCGDLDRARSLAESALAQGPSPAFQHLMGVIECRSGRIDSGVEWLRQASDAEPGNAIFRVMLVRALVDSGRAGEALAASAVPAGNSPPELALLNARAEAADAAGAIPEAIEAWGRLCHTGARDWKACANYGHALAAAGRWADAVNAFRAALKAEPGEYKLRRALSAALAEGGRDDEAADELLRWSEAAPEAEKDRLTVARLLADFGRDEESVRQLDEAVRRSTGRPFEETMDGLIEAARAPGGGLDLALLGELAQLLERTNRMELLGKLLADAEAAGVKREQLAYPAAALALRDGDAEAAKSLLRSGSADADPSRWHWLMARIHDALDEPADAFAEAQAMNRSVADRETWLARGRDYVAAVRAVADIATPQWAAKIRPLDPPERGSPVFLVGFPRSGTTLLDTFLMGHPDSMVLEEVPLLGAAQEALGAGPDLAHRSPAELQTARDAYFAAMDEHVPEEFAGLVIDKFPLNMLEVPSIHALFPDSKMVFAQRHPCDCVLSCFMQAFAMNDSMSPFLDIESAADFFDAAMSFWTRCAEIFPLDVHRIVYEDLVVDPEACLRPLVDFLGLGWREGLLDHQSTAKARGTISTPSYAQVTQPLTRRPSGRWKRYREQLEPVLPILLPWAERLGYRD